MRRFFSLAAVLSLWLLATAPGSGAAAGSGIAASSIPNVLATAQQVSCYTPEVPYAANDGPNDGLDGESQCRGAATTGENVGPYANQSGSQPGYPASTSMLVKDYSESDIRVDPTNPKHLIGSSKSFVSPEGYNHLLGFFESWDGGLTWPVQGHIPGYEGFTENTDPVGAFDGEGNYFEFILPYQFIYDPSGHHDFQPGAAPNPNFPSWAVAVATRPAGSTTASQWIATHNGHTDFVATYNSVGNNPDKQWMAIDTNKRLPNGAPNPNYDNIYLMWVAFDNSLSSLPQVSVSRSDGHGGHSDWSEPAKLPLPNSTQSDTYLLPHIDPNGTVYTTVVQTESNQKRLTYNVFIDFSTDGGLTWQGSLPTPAKDVGFPPICFFPFGCYQNTTFRDGIPNTLGVGSQLSAAGHYPVYLSYEAYDNSSGVTNVMLTASYDGGGTWTNPIRVNDNTSVVDEFQPSLAVSPVDGTVSVAFYDRRWACPAAGTAEAVNAGIALDMSNPRYANTPPYGATNYCVNTSVQFYTPTLTPVGGNIRLTQHSWDPQLNAAHYSCASCGGTFIGDYFGNVIGSDNVDHVASVTTYNDGTNPKNRQQQLVASLTVP